MSNERPILTTAADGFAPCCGAPPKVTEWLPGCYGAQCMECGGTVGDETQMDEGELREAWNRAVSKIRQPGDRSERDITMLVGDLLRQVERMRLMADDTERSICEGDPVRRAFFDGRICCLREQAMNIEDIIANDRLHRPPGAAAEGGTVRGEVGTLDRKEGGA